MSENYNLAGVLRYQAFTLHKSRKIDHYYLSSLIIVRELDYLKSQIWESIPKYVKLTKRRGGKPSWHYYCETIYRHDQSSKVSMAQLLQRNLHKNIYQLEEYMKNI